MSRLPPSAAWRHVEARSGFEVVFFDPGHRDGGRLRIEGQTAAVEGSEAFAVSYAIELDRAWNTRLAHVSGRSSRGIHSVTLEGDGQGNWSVGGSEAPHLRGCLDLDLESSVLTNAFPVSRLRLGGGEQAEAPAAYVRALDLVVERLEQRYLRCDDGSGRERYLYSAPAFDFHCELDYDEAGLLLDYPGIATRVGL